MRCVPFLSVCFDVVSSPAIWKARPTLKFLDLSFCQLINEAVVVSMREQFPNVAIKKSFSV
eukprot:m.113209 g.113209  ORF g.113209 m.113209 type:complete len:61 (-) comp19306_c0_seq2:42-224(-)